MAYYELESQQNATKELLLYLPIVPITYLSGHGASGKTTIAKRVLDKLDDKLISVYVDCCSLTTPTGFLDAIALRLIEKYSTNEIIQAYGDRITSKESFFNFLRVYDEKRQKSKKNHRARMINITLDHVDYLKKSNLIETAQYLWCLNDNIASICFLFISHDSYFLDSFKKQSERAKTQKSAKFIQLVPWTTNDLVLVISEDKPKKRPEIYKDFVRNTIMTFSNKDGTGTNRYYNVLKELCQKNFEEYIKTFHDKSKDKFAANLMLQRNREALKEESLRGQTNTTATHTATFICLLISVYLAAYTTAIDDKTNWIKRQKRVRHAKRSRIERGDKPAVSFTLERLLHIYRHMVCHLMRGTLTQNDIAVLPDQVMEFVSLLERMYIIHRCGGDLLDSDTRYRVTNRLRKSYVQEQARLLQIELTDFVGIES